MYNDSVKIILSKRKNMRIGIVYDLKEDYGLLNKSDYHDFCFFSEAEAAYNNLSLAGYDVEYIGNPQKLVQLIKKNQLNVDLIYNIAEGYKSRNREGLVPAICEAFNIPYTGTDAFGLSLSLHKYQTNIFIQNFGINIPKCILFNPDLDVLSDVEQKIETNKLSYPLILKPNHEGSSMGITLVNSSINLYESITTLVEKFKQSILIQEFISGSELSSCILGTGKDSYIYSLVEYVHLDNKKIDVFTEDIKETGHHKMIEPILSEKTKNEMYTQSLFIHNLLGIRDISRIDWKYDVSKDKLYFIELTPLPDLSIDTEFYWSSVKHNQPYSFVFSEIVNSAMKRYEKILLPK